jgi:outer membrane protein assembly factor BamD (BamD/ComL family)
MSVAGISSSSWWNYENQSVQNRFQQFQQEFQQLGQDLQSGNLSAAQQDFATLQQLGPQNSSTQSAQSNNPIAQAFQQLAQDLQSGNLSAAQQDYTQIQQDFQNQAAAQNQTTEGHYGHHHHHHGGGGESSEINQLFSQLGQALQSGNLSTAQQTYNALLQDLQQWGEGSGQTSTQQSSQSSSSSVSVTA